MEPDFERFARTPWPIACCASCGTKLLSSALAFSCSRCASRVRIKTSAGAHIDNADRLNARLRRLDPEQSRGLAAFHAAPEFALGSDNQVLVKGIGMGGDLHPFAAAGDDRQHGRSGRHHPHIMLELRHVFLRRRFFRKRPGQHELGLKHGLAALNPPIQRGCHPAQHWMPDVPLHIGKNLPGIGLVPASIEVLGHRRELDKEIAGQVLWLGFAALFAPEPDQRLLVIAHDDPGVRAAHKVAAARTFQQGRVHNAIPLW